MVRGAIREALAVGRVRFAILALLFLATALNYFDRAVLGVMQPVLSKTMNWSAQDYADINFWFQLGYAMGFVLQGRFIDRVGAKRAFPVAVILWSLASASHGLAASASGFMICRFLLGLAEAANYPACVKTTRVWFPARERALVTGVFNAGATLGAMITPAIMPPILMAWGWQAVFFSTAAMGIFWVFLWRRFYDEPEEHPRLSPEERAHILETADPTPASRGYSAILRLRITWAFTLAYAVTVPVFWFYLYWLPPFLNQQYKLGISLDQIGLPLIVIYLAADVGGIAGGALSSFLIVRGVPSVRARLLSMLLCAIFIAPIFLAARADSLWMAVFAIAMALGGHQGWTSNIYGIVTDVTPKPLVASVFGFASMAAAVSGMFMTQLVGYVLTATQNNYGVLFTMIPCTYLVALAWMLWMAPRRVEEV